jgi:hypothetical protein
VDAIIEQIESVSSMYPEAAIYSPGSIL